MKKILSYKNERNRSTQSRGTSGEEGMISTADLSSYGSSVIEAIEAFMDALSVDGCLNRPDRKFLERKSHLSLFRKIKGKGDPMKASIVSVFVLREGFS